MALAVRRAELIARARKLLNEVGPEGMTMRGLGQAAGMRAPSLYKHFAGKSELERELAAAGWAELAGLVAAWAAERGADLDRVERGYGRFAEENPALYRVMTRSIQKAEAQAIRTALEPLTGNPDEARRAFATLHGATLLELAGA